MSNLKQISGLWRSSETDERMKLYKISVTKTVYVRKEAGWTKENGDVL